MENGKLLESVRWYQEIVVMSSVPVSVKEGSRGGGTRVCVTVYPGGFRLKVCAGLYRHLASACSPMHGGSRRILPPTSSCTTVNWQPICSMDEEFQQLEESRRYPCDLAPVGCLDNMVAPESVQLLVAATEVQVFFVQLANTFLGVVGVDERMISERTWKRPALP